MSVLLPALSPFLLSPLFPLPVKAAQDEGLSAGTTGRTHELLLIVLSGVVKLLNHLACQRRFQVLQANACKQLPVNSIVYSILVPRLTLAQMLLCRGEPGNECKEHSKPAQLPVHRAILSSLYRQSSSYTLIRTMYAISVASFPCGLGMRPTIPDAEWITHLHTGLQLTTRAVHQHPPVTPGGHDGGTTPRQGIGRAGVPTDGTLQVEV